MMKEYLNDLKKWKKEIGYVLGLALSTICLFMPFEFYFTNYLDIWFAAKDILPFIFFTAIMVSFVCICFFCFMVKGIPYLGIVAYGFLISFYIQGNFIQKDYGLLDGHEINWGSYGNYGVVNVCIWLVVPVILVIVSVVRKDLVKEIIRYSSLGIVGIQIITLGTLFITHFNYLQNKTDYVFTDDEMFCYSGEENIIVFVADTFSTELLERVQIEQPEKINVFDGFEWYTDCVGSYPKTAGAIPYLLSGEWYYNDYPWVEWRENAIVQGEFFQNLKKNGWRLAMYPDLGGFNNVNNVELYDNLSARGYDSALSLGNDYYKLLCFRYMPHYAKRYFTYNTDILTRHRIAIDGHAVYNANNIDFYHYLMGAEIKKDAEKRFKLIHIQGSHFPYNFTADMKEVSDNETDIFSQTLGVIEEFNIYLDLLKDAGVYDNSTIIFMGDHGAHTIETSRPVFMIKEKNKHGKLAKNSAPISMEQFRATIYSVAGIENDTGVASIFEESPYLTTPRKYLFYAGDVIDTMPDLYEFEVYPGPFYVFTGNIHKSVTGELVATSKTTEKYVLGHDLDTTMLYQYAQSGMSEDGWSYSANVYFKIPFDKKVKKDMTGTLNYIKYAEDIIVEIYANGVLLDTVEKDASTIKFSVPKELLKEDVLYLEIKLPNLPFENRDSIDSRRLGINIGNLKITEKKK